MTLADELTTSWRSTVRTAGSHRRSAPRRRMATGSAIACPCGVTFERWVTPQDALEDLLRARLRAERNLFNLSCPVLYSHGSCDRPSSVRLPPTIPSEVPMRLIGLVMYHPLG